MNSRSNCCQKDNSYLCLLYNRYWADKYNMFWTLVVRIAWVLFLDCLTFSFEVVLALACPELPLVEVKAPFILSNS